MTGPEALKAMLATGNPEAVLWDGLDSAITGIGLRNDKPVAVYDYDLMIDAFCAQNPEWTEQDAVEWTDYNVVGAYVGPYTPLIRYRRDDEDDADPWEEE